MTQRETWILHYMAGLTAVSLPTIIAYVFMRELTLPVVAAVFLANAAYWLGRERRDHEIKTGLKAVDWDTGWDVWNWSLDGRLDLLTGVAGGLIPLGLVLLSL